MMVDAVLVSTINLKVNIQKDIAIGTEATIILMIPAHIGLKMPVSEAAGAVF